VVAVATVAHDLGCVKTLAPSLDAQQTNRVCGFGESNVLWVSAPRIKLACERRLREFLHSQDP
jgi:hypothetical protein